MFNLDLYFLDTSFHKYLENLLEFLGSTVSNTRTSDCNGVRTHNLFVRKRTLNHLAKLVRLPKWSSVRVQTISLWVQIPWQFLKIF